MADRTVHATNDLWEIVRYDRAGKWYLEPTDKAPTVKRRPIKLAEAVELAMELWNNGGTVHFGRQGATAFDRKIRLKAGRT